MLMDIICKREQAPRVILGLAALLVLALVVMACGGDNGSPSRSTDIRFPFPRADRDKILFLVGDYVSALRDEDRQKIRDVLRDPTDANVESALAQDRARLAQLVGIQEYKLTAEDQVTVTVEVRDRSGTLWTFTLDVDREQDRWRIRDPRLR